jgi:hypothetical protein
MHGSIDLNIWTLLIGVAVIYLSAGLGFSIASWLQAAEIASDAHEKLPAFWGKNTVFFMPLWIFVALYCYRAEVKKSIKKIDFEELAQDDKALKDCPFCGAEPEIEQFGDNRKSMIIRCSDCGTSTECGSTEISRSRWNDRVKP